MGGPGWTNQCQGSCWLQVGSDECTWYGIICTASGEVSAIYLESNNLRGSLSPAIRNLTSLNSLALSFNDLGGSLPSWIGTLSNLTEIEMIGCNFVGSIPAEIGKLSELVFLYLGQNHLSGPLPVALSSLSNLNLLDLQSNLLTGPFPDGLLGLLMLKNVQLSHNPLNCDLPDVFAPYVTHLQLEHCGLRGSVPAYFAAMPLSVLQLGSNQLGGDLNQLAALYTNLTVLDLSSNLFEGAIPTWIYYSGLLVALDLSNNSFSGPLGPDVLVAELFGGGALVLFDVDDNVNLRSPTGTLPSYLSVKAEQLTVSLDLTYFCRGIHYPGTLIAITLPDEYLDFALCNCSLALYGLPPSRCLPCATNGECPGGNIMSWPRGYYPVNVTDAQGRRAIELVQCGLLLENDCNPNGNCSVVAERNSGLFNLSGDCQLCSEGSYAFRCARCHCREGSSGQCYFYSGGGCVHCSSLTPADIGGIVAAIIVALVVIILVAVLVLRRMKERLTIVLSHTSGPLKILITFVQTSASMGTAWSQGPFFHLLVIMGFANVSTSGVGLQCFVQQMGDPVTALAVGMLMPLVAIAVAVLALCIWRLITSVRARRAAAADEHAESTPLTSHMSAVSSASSGTEQHSISAEKLASQHSATFAERLIKVTLFILNFFYFGLCGKILAVFNCQPATADGQHLYMQSIPWLECSTNTVWGSMSVIAYVCMGFYMFGIPLLFAALLVRFRTRAHDESVAYWLGGLYTSYRPQMFWYELVVIARRVSLAALLSLASTTSALQPVGVFAVFCVSMLVHHLCKPFRSSTENLMEDIGLVIVTLLFSEQLSWRYHVTQANSDTVAANALVYSALVLNVLGAVVMVVVFVPFVVRRVKTQFTKPRAFTVNSSE
eukprot:TRINITY_DN6207_c0_g3_i2.p1 TRINITY_DN6207_c0_g3~~TRINITY_DN6207_c0_g3_i2.p1  ORF type:complete len:933 (+),score=150.48 TRINITY_DN6207_c0_g3_i2:145-2799(+)